jgi:hypothetical protein
MEEAPENGKELSHSVHANGMNEWMNMCINISYLQLPSPSTLMMETKWVSETMNYLLCS